MGLSIAESQATLDARFPTTGATDYVGYSENGSTETSNLARTAIGATGWASATSADPSVKSNNGTVTSADATGGTTITHAAIFSASTGGTQRTDWQALATSRTLAAGDRLEFDAGDIDITLT